MYARLGPSSATREISPFRVYFAQTKCKRRFILKGGESGRRRTSTAEPGCNFQTISCNNFCMWNCNNTFSRRACRSVHVMQRPVSSVYFPLIPLSCPPSALLLSLAARGRGTVRGQFSGCEDTNSHLPPDLFSYALTYLFFCVRSFHLFTAFDRKFLITNIVRLSYDYCYS